MSKHRKSYAGIADLGCDSVRMHHISPTLFGQIGGKVKVTSADTVLSVLDNKIVVGTGLIKTILSHVTHDKQIQLSLDLSLLVVFAKENYLYLSEIDEVFEIISGEYVKIKEFRIRKQVWMDKARMDCELQNIAMGEAASTVKMTATQGLLSVSDEQSTSQPNVWEPKALVVDIGGFSEDLMNIKIELKASGLFDAAQLRYVGLYVSQE